MYLTRLKTLLVVALKTTFDGYYPQADFRNINVGIEYPITSQDYPGVWVDFDETDALTQAGVDHQEFVNVPLSGHTKHTRFRFAGTASFTVVALTSLERDRLYDELVRVMAFGREDGNTSRFRDLIETNDFIAVNGKFDSLAARGNAAAPGTPWGTDEIIYERGLNVDLIGEFVVDPVTGSMLPLSHIVVHPVMDMALDEPGHVPAEPPADDKGLWI